VTETKDPVEFLWEHRVGYVALCGWKYSEVLLEQEHSRAMYLDFFEARRTRAWDRLSIYNPHLVIRGDTCCPSIAMADCILAVVDWTLKRMFYAEKKKLGDDSIRASLRRIGINGEPMFIGQPDLKKIVPYTRDMVVSNHLISRPIFFLCTEKRPEGMTNQQYREMIEYMPVMDATVEMACDNEGSVKFYDVTQDYMLARPGDFCVFYGPQGKEMCDTLRQHVAVEPVDMRKNGSPKSDVVGAGSGAENGKRDFI